MTETPINLGREWAETTVVRQSGTLPVDITSFVGRVKELSESKRLLSNTRLLTLTGVGGVGKTRLALRLAREVRKQYPDGVRLVELAALEDPTLLVPTVAAALGGCDQSAESAMDGLAQCLADKQMLLVLDNCEHMLDECVALVCRLLGAAPALRILATSRQALRVAGEHIVSVPPLSVPPVDGAQPVEAVAQSEAVNLFMERAAAVSPGFTITEGNSATVARLCQRLDGVPLAIELAAVRLRALSVEQLLERLNDVFRLLNSGSRTASPRQQTLRATIDWSYALCSPAERKVWARLSVFCGGFDLAAAERVAAGDGVDREDVLDLVARLVDKSVVLRDGRRRRTRYGLLETMRQYGHEVLADSGDEEAVRRRHLDWCRDLAARADTDWMSPQALESHRQLRAEHANLRVALDFCLSQPGAAHIAFELASVRMYWIAAGRFGEGRHWLGAALELERQPSAARAKALWQDAWLALLQGDTPACIARVEECEALARELGDPSALAHAMQIRGAALVCQGDRDRAVPLLRNALARHRAIGDECAAITALHLLSLAEALLGEPEQALRWGEEGIAACEARGDTVVKYHLLWDLGIARWRQGDVRGASALLRESVEIKWSFRDQLGLAHSVAGLAWVTASDGQAERAARLLGAAAMIWRMLRSPMPQCGHLFWAHDQCVARLRQALGDEAFEAAFSGGTRLTLGAAVSFALGEADTSGGAPPVSGADHLVLTRREQEVATLVAEGLSNKDIAARLVVAQRTAEGHVEHILSKLGFHSRAQIAAWAAERGQVPKPRE